MLLFQFVNLQIPDPLSYGSTEGARSMIRFAVSSIIIVFPVYLWVMRFLERSYAAEPGRKEIRIRKRLTYFTLFAAGLIIMGDLVALVNSFLNGELTTRFLLKILSVFLVAGVVFWYYYWDMKDIKPASMPLFQWAVMVMVIVIVIGAFFFVGSPQTERLRKFDNQRVSDLQTIQWQIINYWQQKEKLPASLSVLEADPIGGFKAPKDLQTGVEYEYIIMGDLSFELCANFSLDTRLIQEKAMPSFTPTTPAREFPINGGWEHGTGRKCFERTVDPELYPPRSVLEKPLVHPVPAVR